MTTNDSFPGLYSPAFEHDACGVGFVANINGQKSHEVIEQGLLILKNLDHRGAVGADALMGDGAGVLLQIPDALYRREMAAQGVELPPTGEYGVGMVFLPKESASRLACQQEIERSVRAEGQVVLGWRDVPINTAMPMSPVVRAREPVIRQIFIGRGNDIMVSDALERKLYVIRKSSGHAIQALRLKHGKEFFVPSMSTRTVVYKGLLLAGQVGDYYLDLKDPLCLSALILVHQRFSTNTMPEWALAHPYRMIAHNGEINTVKGNFNWMRAREGVMKSAVLGDDLKKLLPLIYEGQSDTACFDNVLELLVMSGYPIAQAMMMMIPEAWENHDAMDPNRRAFYEYHAAMMEPWDGPASMAFTDGRYIGGTLDRNGLRPARIWITDDGLVVMASEAGVLPIEDARIARKTRLQPGKMFLIDMDAGRIIDDQEIKQTVAAAKPYRQWIESVRLKLDDIATAAKPSATPSSPARWQFRLYDSPLSVGERTQLQQAFGYSREDFAMLLKPMALQGEEAMGAMGNDVALPVLSRQDKPLYNYFKQQFAQVTNPPIDPIREALVMSLVSFIGPRPNLLDKENINPPIRIAVEQPILDAEAMSKLYDIDSATRGKFRSYALNICYPCAWGAAGIEARLASLAAEAVDAVRSGHNILILTDTAVAADVFPIPALLATSTIHQHLIACGLRTTTGLVVETGSAREVHHFALLAGYGAEAIYPYLALHSVAAEAARWAADSAAEGKAVRLTPEQAVANFCKAVGKGLKKVMSKMGISTYMSYCGAQIFEVVGINRRTVEKYFRGTPSHIEGMGLFEIAEEALRVHQRAFAEGSQGSDTLPSGGEYAVRVGGEDHMWTMDSIAKLQHATRANSYTTYKEYAQLINDQSQRQMTLRGLLQFKFDPANSIPLEEVEPAREIVKRFTTGAMSLGSISTEAHTTLAIAMNRIGGKSNTGEGGEDALRYRDEMAGKSITAPTSVKALLGASRVVADIAVQPGDSLRSRIKQVASARFGVTSPYLVSADQIQIKMAQGAKPGEGGQLPGHKVSEYIGALRYSVPGVGLISPPPHHDIYSIEDLAQLIHDLKNVNQRASISVKLVSEVGVGTVAAGVAKAKADHVVIAGHDGGTGASPLSSIKHAGTPWEIGLAETQQALVLNGLRSRIRVQADGQMKTGRDVVIAALLGADEVGFATAPLVVEGCIMTRKCHLNTCPVGVATQDPVLRQRFSGQPEHVVNYFFFVAEEVRQLMAQLGIRRFGDLVGRCDFLQAREGVEHWKAKGLDFSRVLYRVSQDPALTRHCDEQDHGLEKALDHKLIAQSAPALERGEHVSFITSIQNINRSVGGMLAGEMARRWGGEGLPDDSVHVQLQGTAGQSFGLFLPQGVTFDLIGEANDYVGKGLCGGRLIVRPNPQFRGVPAENIIAGNTVLYGATSGEAYFCGVAGERFAVRNSGAAAVVEGVGDHGCEYMTGGTVVVLGATGRNFAAGMSGGVAFVFDPDGFFARACNTEMVGLEKVVEAKAQDAKTFHRWLAPAAKGGRRELCRQADEVILKTLLDHHYRYTGSNAARRILDSWKDSRAFFVKVLPLDYRAALVRMPL